MNRKISFTELVENISQETGASEQLIHDLLKETINVTREGLSRDGHVHVNGLGRFSLKWHDTRMGRNPRTGEEIEIPAHSVVHFKAESDLRKFINRKYAHLKPELLEEERTPPVPVAALQEDTAPPVIPSEQDEDKKRSTRWLLWLIPLLLILLLAYLFWPRRQVTDIDSTQPIASEQADETTPPLDAEQADETAPSQAEEAEEPPEEPVAEEEPVSEEVMPGTSGGTHTTAAGDKLWTISLNFYNQGNLWPNIYRVNLAQISNPDRLAIGGEIQVPGLQGEPGNLTDTDKKNIAEGFMEVYLAYKKSGNRKARHYLWVAKMLHTEVFEQYSERVVEADLRAIETYEGELQIK